MFDHRWTLVVLAGILPSSAPISPADAALCEAAEPSGRADLAPVAGSTQPDAAGRVEFVSGARGSRLEVEVRRVDPVAPLSLFIDDGTGTMLAAGTFPAGRDERRLVFDSSRGEDLPAGARAGADLAGRFLEVRDADGAAILVGSIPSPTPASAPGGPSWSA